MEIWRVQVFAIHTRHISPHHVVANEVSQRLGPWERLEASPKLRAVAAVKAADVVRMRGCTLDHTKVALSREVSFKPQLLCCLVHEGTQEAHIQIVLDNACIRELVILLR